MYSVRKPLNVVVSVLDVLHVTMDNCYIIVHWLHKIHNWTVQAVLGRNITSNYTNYFKTFASYNDIYDCSNYNYF